MPKYLFGARYSAEGVKGVLKEGGSKRREAVDQGVRSVGGKLECFYYAFGENDVVGVIEFPDQASAAAFSAATNSSGLVTVSLTPLITVEEIDAAAKKSPQYRPPGR